MTDFILSIQGLTVIYFTIVTLVGFLMMAIDKQKAKRQRWRIPEKVLMVSAALGGSIGVLFGMHLFHHKTKKPLFYVGVPFILILQLGALYLLVR